MARLNIDRQKQLEPERIRYAKKKLEEAGMYIFKEDNTKLMFHYRNSIITFYPYSGWATGHTIKDGRGLRNLLKQLK